MKALIFTQYGSPDGLQLCEIPKPTPKDDELLIELHASSVNSWDWEFLNGTPFINRLMFGLLKPKPGKQVLGAYLAGTIKTVGRHVTKFRPGDEVFGDLWSDWGGFAEYARVCESSGELKPANVTFEEAAVVPQAGVLVISILAPRSQRNCRSAINHSFRHLVENPHRLSSLAIDDAVDRVFLQALQAE